MLSYGRRHPRNSDHFWLLDSSRGERARGSLPADSSEAGAHHLGDGEADARCSRPQQGVRSRESGVGGVERRSGGCVLADCLIRGPDELSGNQPAQQAGDEKDQLPHSFTADRVRRLSHGHAQKTTSSILRPRDRRPSPKVPAGWHPSPGVRGHPRPGRCNMHSIGDLLLVRRERYVNSVQFEHADQRVWVALRDLERVRSGSQA